MSLVPLELPLPQWIFVIGIKHPLDMPVSAFMTAICATSSDRCATPASGLDCDLPLRQIGFFFRLVGDVVGGVP